ncbi:MAG: 5-(carboxyamino)imidazole ribonucleotide synthase [Burkholderiales bacterium]|nr:5-(carboxyamino)imidazole ribonucleotide synthase [Burkholderiales bacterium]
MTRAARELPRMIEPGAFLGLLGGGQLGRMFTMAAQSMGYRVMVLDPGADSPAGSVADAHVQADYLDAQGLRTLASHCAAVTTEFENVPAESLRFLSEHCRVSPAADSVAVAQDRIREKQFLASAGLEVAPYKVIESAGDLAEGVAHLLPGILKRSRLGYDGKGQIRAEHADQLGGAFAHLGGEPCVLERRLALALELSCVVARGLDGRTIAWPVAENEHASGILDVSIVPARVPPGLAAAARDAALAVAERLDYRGVLCVEFFVLDDGRLLANEIAPRPHNSGHYTIDACVTSQFEQQARALCGMPLGDTALHGPAVMVNVLGDLWACGEPRWEHVLRIPRAKLHLYGKREARPGRKMGHYTVLADSVEEALRAALDAREALRNDAAVAL